MNYRIKEYRKASGMTQAELALKSRVSRAIISGLENGKIKVTTTGTLVKLSSALGKQISEIFL